MSSRVWIEDLAPGIPEDQKEEMLVFLASTGRIIGVEVVSEDTHPRRRGNR